MIKQPVMTYFYVVYLSALIDTCRESMGVREEVVDTMCLCCNYR